MLDKNKIEKGKNTIKKLVQKFHNNRETYLSPKYKEEDIKVEFITPMFKALGWDVENEKNKAPRFKEVIFEETINIGNKTKNPDYTFQIGEQRIFFLEAKAPYKNLKHNKSPAYQVRRYGWSAKLKTSILTDFEELSIYETTTRPKKTQTAGIGRIKYYKYTDYVEKWEEIYSIYSKEAVQKGYYDKFVEDKGIVKKRGTSTVDDEFLKEISEWRVLLARNIALRNPLLNINDLNYAVQLIIDRIIFLRMCEDREIEPYGTLQNLLNKQDIYKEFGKLCLRADAKYNSGLFHFHKEPNAPDNVDTFTLDLNIDDAVFKQIFKNLYYPDCPYEFSVISPQILGSIYERFLGSTIRLTQTHKAKVDVKIEARKLGGVYYTPQHIVDYILLNTLGKVIDGKTPEEISKIRILDPACGSGSFLLGAYLYLLEYHANYYSRMKNPPRGVFYRDKKRKSLRLSIDEKKRILVNNIYGVDIDANAVEVTKLSLLLQVLEGDANQLREQQVLLEKRVLPNLADNIKCGNSLVGGDVILEDGLGHEDVLLLNPFDWSVEFDDVLNGGGFDVVIGNPPYVRSGSIGGVEKEYLKKHYDVYNGNADYYVYFYEQIFKNLLKPNGYFGMICSNKFTRSQYGAKLRELLLNYNIHNYTDYTKHKVFKDANVDPSVLIMSKNYILDNMIIINNKYKLPQTQFTKDVWIFNSPEETRLKEKILQTGTPLGKLNIKINRGITSGCNKAFVIDGDERIELIDNDKNCADLIKPILGGKDIKYFNAQFKNKYLLYIPWDCKINDFPSIKNHLLNFEKELKDRSEVKQKRYNWYCLSRYNAKAVNNFNMPKIIWAEISRNPAFTLDTNEHLILNSAYMLNSFDDDYPLLYLLGLLNSNVVFWIFKRISSVLSDSLRFTNQYVSRIPIVRASKSVCDEVCGLVVRLLDLYGALDGVSSPHEVRVLNEQIRVLEDGLNRLVYDLYGLSDDDVSLLLEDI